MAKLLAENVALRAEIANAGANDHRSIRTSRRLHAASRPFARARDQGSADDVSPSKSRRRSAPGPRKAATSQSRPAWRTASRHPSALSCETTPAACRRTPNSTTSSTRSAGPTPSPSRGSRPWRAWRLACGSETARTAASFRTGSKSAAMSRCATTMPTTACGSSTANGRWFTPRARCQLEIVSGPAKELAGQSGR